LWEDSNELWEACVEYFEWIEANPLKEGKLFQFQGEIVDGEISKMRAMTIGGLCIFLGINRSTWQDYRTKDDFSGIVEQVDEIIRDQKFSGAAAGLLNSNIIARDLGLKELSEQDIGNKGGKPFKTEAWQVEFVNATPQDNSTDDQQSTTGVE